MKLDTPEIAWHGKEPILSVDFSKVGSKWRLASAGADKDIKIWSIAAIEDQHSKVEFLANLSRHTKAVNVVRFSPKEEILASGGDDSMIILWKLSSSSDQNGNDIFMEDDDLQNKESWTFHKALRGHIEDVYDLSWSPDGNNIISGSIDNSAIIWDVAKGQKLVILKDHKHYVQGVCWDPLGQYVATNSSDRSCRLYNPNSYRCCYNISKLLLTGSQKTVENGESFKQGKMFHDETMPSFFRRPSYSPDGSLLFVPAGRLDVGDQVVNTTYVFTRASPNKPVLYLPSPQKASIAVRCCPILFELRQDNAATNTNEDKSAKSLFKLPYRMVFAVATLDSVLLYDTQQAAPFAFVSNIHYAALTDITWSSDGSMLVVSSSDGYCSIVHFDEGELGKPYNLSVKVVLERSSSPLPPISDTPGKVGKKLTSGPSAEKPNNEEKIDKPTQGTIRKEPVSKISMFTVPMKITPTKPAAKVAPKRITLTPVPVNPPTGSSDQTNSLPVQSVASAAPTISKQATLTSVPGQLNAGSSPVTNAASQITPRRVSLMPAENKQAHSITNGIKSTAQMPSRRITPIPVNTTTPVTKSTETRIHDQTKQKPPSPTLGLRHAQTPNLSDSKGSSNENTSLTSAMSSVDMGTGSSGTIPQRTPANAPRRVPLTTLSAGAGSAQPKQFPATNVKSDSKESSVIKQEKVKNVKDISNESTAAQQSTPLETSNSTVKSSQKRRIALTPVPMESPKNNLSQPSSVACLVDKENKKVNQLPSNGQPQPRRVSLTTMTPLVGESAKDLQNGSGKSPVVQGAPRNPIPLEPTIIVLGD